MIIQFPFYYGIILLFINQQQQSTMAEQEQVFTSLTDPEWINRNRTLIVSSRGMTAHQRHFMLSIFALLPHAKKDFKLEKYNVGQQIQQLCDHHHARYFMYFEVKKKINFSLWLGRYPEGPSVKLQLDGVVLNKDIKFQGNSVKGARHILSFDQEMETNPKLKLIKELLVGAFNIPKMHPKSTGVIDHTLNFTSEDGNICFKNYQIFRQALNKDKDKMDLYEIGPRFLLCPLVILDGVISGEVLYRAPIMKKVPVKSKNADKQLGKTVEDIKQINIFGEEMEEQEIQN